MQRIRAIVFFKNNFGPSFDFQLELLSLVLFFVEMIRTVEGVGLLNQSKSSGDSLVGGQIGSRSSTADRRKSRLQ